MPGWQICRHRVDSCEISKFNAPDVIVGGVGVY